jgi:hypothetical protein
MQLQNKDLKNPTKPNNQHQKSCLGTYGKFDKHQVRDLRNLMNLAIQEATTKVGYKFPIKTPVWHQEDEEKSNRLYSKAFENLLSELTALAGFDFESTYYDSKNCRERVHSWNSLNWSVSNYDVVNNDKSILMATSTYFQNGLGWHQDKRTGDHLEAFKKKHLRKSTNIGELLYDKFMRALGSPRNNRYSSPRNTFVDKFEMMFHERQKTFFMRPIEKHKHCCEDMERLPFKKIYDIIYPEDLRQDCSDFIKYLQIIEHWHLLDPKTKTLQRFLERLKNPHLRDILKKRYKEIVSNPDEIDENGNINLEDSQGVEWTFQHKDLEEVKNGKDFYQYYLEELSKYGNDPAKYDKEFLNSDFCRLGYAFRLGFNRKEITDILYLDIDNMGDKNALIIANRLIKKLKLNNKNAFAEYSWLGSGGIHLCVKLNDKYNEEQRKRINKKIQEFVLEVQENSGMEFKVEIPSPKGNTCLIFSNDYRPLDLEKLGSFKFAEICKEQFNPIDVCVDVDHLYDFVYRCFDRKKSYYSECCSVFCKLLKNVELRAFEPKKWTLAPATRVWKRNVENVVKVSRFKTVDEICVPFKAGQSNKMMYQQALDCAKNNIPMEDCKEAMLKYFKSSERYQLNHGSASVYFEKSGEKRVELSIENAYKNVGEVYVLQDSKDAEQSVSVEISVETPEIIPFHNSYYNTFKEDAIEHIFTRGYRLADICKKNLMEKRKCIMKRGYISNFLKILAPEFFMALMDCWRYNYQNNNLKLKQLFDVENVNRTLSVSRRYFSEYTKDLLKRIENFQKDEYERFHRYFNFAMDDEALENLKDNIKPIRKFLGHHVDDIINALVDTYGLEFHKLKRIIWDRREGEKIFTKTLYLSHCTGFSKAILIASLQDFQKIMQNFLKILYPKHECKARIFKTRAIRERYERDIEKCPKIEKERYFKHPVSIYFVFKKIVKTTWDMILDDFKCLVNLIESHFGINIGLPAPPLIK